MCFREFPDLPLNWWTLYTSFFRIQKSLWCTVELCRNFQKLPRHLLNHPGVSWLSICIIWGNCPDKAAYFGAQALTVIINEVASIPVEYCPSLGIHIYFILLFLFSTPKLGGWVLIQGEKTYMENHLRKYNFEEKNVNKVHVYPEVILYLTDFLCNLSTISTLIKNSFQRSWHIQIHIHCFLIFFLTGNAKDWPWNWL